VLPSRYKEHRYDRNPDHPLVPCTKTIEHDVQDVQWPGRHSFHFLHIPIHPVGNTTTAAATPLFILADGAHNPASARTLWAYNSTHYLHPQYILALPHSPPKTHLHLHLYILRNLSPNLKPSIALLPFTPPAGMPWVRPVGPHVLHETVVQLFRSTVPDEASLDITNLVEIRIFDDDTHTPETNTPEPQNININTSITKGIYHPLFDALRWAAARHRPAEAEDLASQRRGLVVPVGSLYLLADLNRLLEGGLGSGGVEVTVLTLLVVYVCR